MNTLRQLFSVRTLAALRQNTLSTLPVDGNHTSRLNSAAAHHNNILLPKGFPTTSLLKNTQLGLTKQYQYLDRKLEIIYRCKICNTRNIKTVSEAAYNNGVVILQCDGCSTTHLIVDNLGWFTNSKGKSVNQVLAEKAPENLIIIMYHHIMSFHWGTDVGVFLFPGLDITGTPALIILCVVLLVLSLIYEAVKVFQTSSKARTARERLQSSSSTANETTNLLISERRTASGNASASNRFLSMLAQAVVFLFENVLSYMLMLSVMVYNVYVFMAIVLGMGLGYFLFGHISMRINMENIRARTTNAICSEVNRLAVTSSSPRNVGENEVEFQGNPHCSTSYSQSANYEPVSNIQSEVDVHPCVDAQNTDNLHTCRL